jgi:hypothetical protein
MGMILRAAGPSFPWTFGGLTYQAFEAEEQCSMGQATKFRRVEVDGTRIWPVGHANARPSGLSAR